MRRAAAVPLGLGFLLAACTAPTPDPAADPSATRPTASATTAEPAPGPRQPLVLVTHMTRPQVRLGLAGARAILRGEDDRWRVVAAPGTPDVDARFATSAAAAVRAVARDPGVLAVLPAAAVGPTVRAVSVGGVDPMRDPASYPLTVAGPRPPRPTSLTVVGDVMLGRGVPDPAAALAPLGRRLRAADLTVGNLESTLSTAGQPQQGGDSFAADPGVLGLLFGAGFDAMSLANNHTGDFEEQALLRTVRLFKDSPVHAFGAGRDRAAAGRAVVLERRGTRFGFVGFNAIGETPRATRDRAGALSVRMPPRTGPLVRADLDHVAGLVRRLDGRVDVVVVVPHWGTQYTHEPEPVQRRVAKVLVGAGADLVVGGHPHWVQGIDVVGDALVAHSLGNFVFDMDFMTETQQGVILEATYWGDRLVAVDLVPCRMDGSFAPRTADGPEGAEILADVWGSSTGPFKAR